MKKTWQIKNTNWIYIVICITALFSGIITQCAYVTQFYAQQIYDYYNLNYQSFAMVFFFGQFIDIFVPFLFGTYIVDKFGSHTALILIALMSVSGVLLVYFGIKLFIISLFTFGTSILIVAHELMNLSTDIFLFQWVPKEYSSFVLLCNNSFQYFSLFILGYQAPYFYSYSNQNLSQAMLYFFLLCIIAFILSCLLFYFEQLSINQQNAMSQIQGYPQHQTIQKKTQMKFNLLFWVFIAYLAFNDSMVLYFFDFGQLFLVKTAQITVEQASRLMGIYQLIPCIFCPICGYFSDKLKKKGYQIVISELFSLSILSLLLNYICQSNNMSQEGIQVLFIVKALDYTLYQIFILLIFTLVEKSQYGCAYGTFSAMLNLDIIALLMSLSIVFFDEKSRKSLHNYTDYYIEEQQQENKQQKEEINYEEISALEDEHNNKK